MIVLSLFDGMSCGRVALDRAGISVTKYYASEVDKYAVQVSANNYPDTIQLGDVNNWEDWSIDKPDLIIGGSPCQGFSFAGKQLAFDDPRSALFWKYVEIVRHYKPKYFLLENVRMKKEHLQVITDALGVEPICINSALVSAQNRVRYYWTNIPNVTQPEDKGIVLADILESEGTGWVKSHGEWHSRDNKSMCLDANYHKGADNHGQRTMIKQPAYVQWDESSTGSKVKVLLDTHAPNLYYRKLTPIECERLQTLPDNYTAGVSNTQRYKMLGNGWTVDVLAHIFKGVK